MEERKELFATGDSVTWDGDPRSTEYRQCHGTGPFRIIEVTLSRQKCTCGAGDEAPDKYHFEHCGVHIEKDIRHPQLVRIASAETGQSIGHAWCGRYFKKV